MRILFILLGFVLAESAFAQKEYNVLNWKSSTSLYTHLSQRMYVQYFERRATLEMALSSPQSIQAYRDSCKARYRHLVGALPSRTKLNAQITGTIQKENYRIDKVIYESIPNHHVTANLYVPKGAGPFPGVLFFCGHEMEAKATVSYQQTATLFAANGFVVLVIDPISQAERFQLVDVAGTPIARGGTTEHTLLNAAANLVGTGVVAFELWDNIRGLDYLESLPMVDKAKLGCLGNSGGGTQTTYFIAFDERIKVAAPCSYIASRERNWDLVGANDGCQHIPGEGQEQLEISDFLIMFSPKPLMILAGLYDFVDYVGTQHAYAEVMDVYTVLGEPDKIKLFTVDDGHGISMPKRDAAVRWFRRWLYGDTNVRSEEEITPIPQNELNCTSTGQVSTAYTNEVDDLDRVQTLATALKEKSKSNTTPISSRVKALCSKHGNSNPVTSEAIAVFDRNGNKMYKLILRKEGEVPIPAIVLYPTNVKEVVVWFHGEGKHVIADSAELIKKYLAEGKAVVMADLRGLGEGKDESSANDPKYYNSEYRCAMLALHLGDPLPIQRSRDIGTVLDFITSDPNLKGHHIQVKATGVAALSALQSGVIDSRINSVDVSECISSFTEIFSDPTRKDWYSYVIPGVLGYYDIDDLKNLLARKQSLKATRPVSRE